MANLQALSDADNDRCTEPSCNEQLLRVTLDNLRNDPALSDATTTTYDPLVGMTSQTDPNGVTTYYEYDDFGRLKNTTDAEGNTVQQINYNYKD